MATTLIEKETAKTSVNTYYKLELNSITRNQKIVTANCKITITLGSGTDLDTNNNRTLKVYDSSNTEIYSLLIKDTNKSWVHSTSYPIEFSFTYDTGGYTDWEKTGFYIRITQTTGSTDSCIWDGTTPSGGTAGQTFKLSAKAAGVVRIKIGTTWKTGIVYIKTINGWKQGIPYVKTSGGWKIGI